MSNVLARKRGISEMEFYGTAEKLRTELSSLLFRDKATPKKYRANVTYPALAAVNRMMALMHKANKIFPYTPEDVTRRKEIQQECIDCLDEVYEILQYAMRNVWWQTLHATNSKTGEPTLDRQHLEYHLSVIGELLDREERLLTGWKRSTKQLNH